MGPHPIIMHVLWDDRSREVEAAVRWSRFAYPVAEAADADSPPAGQHHLVGRALALLALARGLVKGRATSTPV